MEAEIGHAPHQLWIPTPTVPPPTAEWAPQARDREGRLLIAPPAIEAADCVYQGGSCFNNGCPYTAIAGVGLAVTDAEGNLNMSINSPLPGDFTQNNIIAEHAAIILYYQNASSDAKLE